MYKKTNNYAYIDGQNLNLGVQSLGWKLDYRRFRIYLREKYNITNAYLFIGFIPENHKLYTALQQSGYILKFKPTLANSEGQYKGNLDGDLILQLLIDFFDHKFDAAVIVTSDGDFYSVVKFLYDKNKLLAVLSPYLKTCSYLLRRTAREKLQFMNTLKNKLEYKRKTPPKDETN